VSVWEYSFFYGAAIYRKYVLVLDKWFIYETAIYMKYVFVWEQ
jgi:hypothetical protein